ncbi:hypothetical protein [Microcoleus sp. FACHB-68]|uniref:hypothetical protein n=1 Tax=Microcoleus sp. FACHB-68 TaxID=2692826 RepID=UPI001685DC85|nr:hypothetical protein [Microcoleus sp. FACHB-68]MBD1936719.1 hypothetical protein [Microcoleus sp. FACHB-68]
MLSKLYGKYWEIGDTGLESKKRCRVRSFGSSSSPHSRVPQRNEGAGRCGLCNNI